MNFSQLNTPEVTREFYFNIGRERELVYLFLILSAGYLIWSIVKRIKIWRAGKSELRHDRPFARMLAVLKYAILQAKVLREFTAGIMHAALFFGFAALVAVTAILTIQEDITFPLIDFRFLYGHRYILWSLFADTAGVIVLAGLIVAIARRYIVKNRRLDTKGTDTLILVLLLVIILSGFMAEALRIAITGFPEFEIWPPAGFALARLFSGIDTGVLNSIHYTDWWVHMSSSFLFIALLATGKPGHVLITMINIYFMNLENESDKTKYAVPVIDPAVFETAESFGVSRVEEFTWKQLMDGDACTRCGRCQDNCPAFLTDKPLSPKKMINDIKDNMDIRIPQLIAAEDRGALSTLPLIGDGTEGSGSVQPDEFWSCTNCAACMHACPVNIEHIPKIIDMRRNRVLMEGDMAPELQTTFINMETNYNPYGFAFAERGAWLPPDLGIKTLAEDPDVDYVYFAGCAASYDKRNQKVAIAFLKIMQRAGFKTGILGAEEACCGDAAMRGGNEYLFHSLAAQNLETFKAYGVKKIITACPHGYNVLKKEYASFAKTGKDADGNPLEYNFQVFHHTEIISELISSGKIKLKEALKEKVTYHDSCFLGRYNEIYDGPRKVIKSIPGTEYVEMSRNHDRSFCCGAGGARMFIEEHLGSRINRYRTEDAMKTGAKIICTPCPFCMTMLSDGVTELGYDSAKVFDIAELVCESMEKA